MRKKVELSVGQVELDDAMVVNADEFELYEKAYVIGHEFGAIAIVFADHEAEALDIACDENRLECFLIDNPTEEDYEHHTPLGNASELHNLDCCWAQELPKPDRLSFVAEL